jgi:hypothetical protein
MASPLPSEDAINRVWRLNDTAALRLQAISFFALGLLLCAAAVRWLWNSLQRDFPKLPRLSFGKALAGVLLWGLLFIIVLAMISGARELMTPGAWRKQGFTYQLADAGPEATAAAALRRQHLERLRTALWHYAALHQGRFPSAADGSDVPPELWEVPGSGGLRYLYVPGLAADDSAGLLVYEPELDSAQRFVLQTNGEILPLSSADVRDALDREKRP